MQIKAKNVEIAWLRVQIDKPGGLRSQADELQRLKGLLTGPRSLYSQVTALRIKAGDALTPAQSTESPHTDAELLQRLEMLKQSINVIEMQDALPVSRRLPLATRSEQDRGFQPEQTSKETRSGDSEPPDSVQEPARLPIALLIPDGNWWDVKPPKISQRVCRRSSTRSC